MKFICLFFRKQFSFNYFFYVTFPFLFLIGLLIGKVDQKNNVAIISLNDLGNISLHQLIKLNRFLLINPLKQDIFKNLSDFTHTDNVTLFTLLKIMSDNPWLAAIGWPTGIGQAGSTYCHVKKQNWTTIFATSNENHHKLFKNGMQHLFLPNSVNRQCIPCDTLPGEFILRSSAISYISNLDKLGRSSLLHLFLNLRGKVAFCHQFSAPGISNYYSKNAYNNVPLFWDQKFVLYPKLTGIWRIIVLNGDDSSFEAWLGCVWSNHAYLEQLPISCHNFNRQYLFDITDILNGLNLTFHYQLIYGSLLGAVRNNDVIPWSHDADIALVTTWNPYNKFTHYVWKNIETISDGCYSHIQRQNMGMEYKRDQFDIFPIRAFPSCPVVFQKNNAADIWNKTRNMLIDSKITDAKLDLVCKSYDEDWRSTGYLDLFVNAQIKYKCRKFLKEFKIGYVGKRQFYVPCNTSELLHCLYGHNWMDIPEQAKGNWSCFTGCAKCFPV